MLTADDITIAIQLAAANHDGQTYNDRNYLTGHLLEVRDKALELSQFYLQDDALQIKVEIVAILHDIIEDTIITYQDINKLFGKEIADCISLLTRSNKSDETYFREISTNPIAKLVKAADRIINLELMSGLIEKDKERAKQIIRKYSNEMKYIEEYNIYPNDIRSVFNAALKNFYN